MTPVSMVKPDSLLQIDDQKIRAAFELQPQLTTPLVVGIYNASFDDHEFLDSLEELKEIESIFEISPWMVEGDNYEKRKQSRWYGSYNEPTPTPMQAVRLQAAKGKADLLIYCGITHTYKEDPNWLAWTYLGLITMAFVPGQKYKLTTEVDLFFIDVRNGYLYGAYHDEITEKKLFKRMSFSSSIKFDEKKSEHVNKLIPEMKNAVKRLLNNKKFYLNEDEEKRNTLEEKKLIPVDLSKENSEQQSTDSLVVEEK